MVRQKEVQRFVDYINLYIQWYPTRNVFIPMGGDFQYEAAEKNYINMDRFINSQPALKLKTDDFFPYSSDALSFWTGYFTSRPNSKRFERIGHNILQKRLERIHPIQFLSSKAPLTSPTTSTVREIETIPSSRSGPPEKDKKPIPVQPLPKAPQFLDAAEWNVLKDGLPIMNPIELLTRLLSGEKYLTMSLIVPLVTKQLVASNGVNESDNENNVNSLRYLREIMGIMQHHDAITGTEKQHVANDYVRLLTRGIEYAEKPTGEIIRNLLQTSISEKLDINLELSSCLLSNISICHISQNSDKFIVTVYNPLAWPVTHYVRLPVNNKKFDIQGPDGQETYDIVDTISDFAFAAVPNEVPSKQELVFAAKEVPPMGIKLYYVNQVNSLSEESVEPSLVKEDLQFGNDQTNFQIDGETNLLKSVKINGIKLDITQNFYFYYGATGDADKTHVASGAYLFRPTQTTPESFINGVLNTGIVKGEHVEEFHQKWSDNIVDISQIIRVYKSKEIISKFTVSNFDNKGVFYTDANGREMIKRTLNLRPDYTYNSILQPVASNYYPITSKIIIKDEDKDLELAVHRRLMKDDNKGVGENLNETEFDTGVYVRGSHYLLFGSSTKINSDGKSTAAQERILAQKKLNQPWIGIGDATSDALAYDQIKSKLNFKYSALLEALPENINILSFEPWTNNTYLLRFEHIMEKNDDPDLSKPATLDIDV
ncbi:hypothetical protein NQ314_002606 [Rhamnusium bicolor]|uniref:Glycoside hydrolase family 38 central domain-containing protein n=1 Tax=Rhamnusium bicolor TaxID=1586634 RepID=A0AAV8ZP97_9CUCU|nr:hypothetical protein NQ314_002606 [Rhamnusium bicolor]